MKKRLFPIIAMIISFLGCSKDSSTSTTPASTKPHAEFTINYDGKTKAPVQVSFTNNSKNAKSYMWDFDNGVTSSSSASTVWNTYGAAGIYVVSLKAIGEPGDTASTVEVVTIK